MPLLPGANAPLSGPRGTLLVTHEADTALDVNLTAFVTDAQGRALGDASMVFYNQPRDPAGAATFLAPTSDGGRRIHRIDFDLSVLPAAGGKLAITITEDGCAGFVAVRGLRAEVRTGDASVELAPGAFGSERGIIVLELYVRADQPKVRSVWQGFAGGLASLCGHFGIEVDDAPAAAPATAASAPAAPPAPPAAPTKPVSLTKPGQTHALSLVKGAAAPRELVVEATWIDNGDDSDDNDDLDLRVGILWPNGRMALVTAPDRPGGFDARPWVVHTGDQRIASKNAPSTETVRVNPAIARHAGGPVAIVFSVYSAVGNGMVSVASMRPKMRIAYGDQRVECAFDFTSKKGVDDDVYTYVIGLVEFDGDRVVVQPSGLTSESGSEETPWLRRTSQGVQITVDGPSFFKGDDATDPTDDGRDYE
jgi:tellurite resistance protein TerA